LLILEKLIKGIYRESLINVLKEFEMPQKLINLIKMSIKHTDIKVKVRHSTLNVVQVTTGLRKGDALSPIVVNLIHIFFVMNAARKIF